MHPQQFFMQVNGAGNMILEICMSLLPAICNHERSVIKMILQPFGRYPGNQAIIRTIGK